MFLHETGGHDFPGSGFLIRLHIGFRLIEALYTTSEHGLPTDPIGFLKIVSFEVTN